MTTTTPCTEWHCHTPGCDGIYVVTFVANRIRFRCPVCGHRGGGLVNRSNSVRLALVTDSPTALKADG
jgi:hypothetical protein